MEQEENPLPPGKRDARTLTISVGGLSALLGLIVLVGWHTNNPRLIQLTPISAFMAYNTALSFLLCGVGFLAFALRPFRAVVPFCGTLVGAVGLLTLSEYCFGLHLGIDQLFMADYIQPFSAYPGRMAPSTAFCFTLAGGALFLIGRSTQWKCRPLFVGTIGSVLFALGMMSLFRYWTGLVVLSEGQWNSFIRPMGIHTAAGFVVLGLGIFALAWGESQRKRVGTPHWLPVSIFVAVSAGTVLLWQALVEHEYLMTRQLFRTGLTPSPLPVVILLGGCTLAVLLSVAAALAQKARYKTKLLNESNQILAREIALHRQAEESLQKQTSLMRTVLTCMSEDVIVADEQGKILIMNQAAQRTLGVSPTTAPADAPIYDWSRLAHIYLPDQQTPFPVAQLPLVRALRGETVTECEQFVLCPGASEGVWRSVNGRPLRDAEGKVCGGVTVGRNITERKQMDAALQKQTEILHSVLNSMADGVVVADENEKILIFNPAAVHMFGQGVTDTRSGEWSQQYALYLPETETPFPTEELPLTRALRGKASDGVEVLVRHAHAPEGVWMQVSGRPLKDQDGTVKGGVVVCRDITEHKQAEAALRESEERFRYLCTASPVGISQTDARGITVYTNSRWQEITGLTLEESLGYGWAHAIHPEDREAVFTEWHTRVAAGHEFSKEFRFARPTGEVRWVDVQAAPLRSDDGVVVGYVGVTMDITDRKEVDRMKDEFVSVVSHELRTPLTSIRGSLGLLASGRLGTLQEKGQRMLDIAVANTDRLVRLINDILDIERMQSGKIAMQKQKCDAADLMTQAMEVMRALAEKAEVTLSVAPHSTRLWADPDRILQTLTNLLSNAIKFSPRGTTVRLTAEHQDGHLLVHVKDQGRGIPADKLESIFERFQQVDASDSRDKGGTGLGLAICRSIVQQHGGRIWVESTLGEGSTFSFTLPTLSGAETNAPEGSLLALRPAVNGQARAACVLVAEDDSDLARVMMLTLQRHGIESFYARTGQEAIQLSQCLSPDLVILDLFMPDGDGFTVVNWFRQQNGLRHVPLVVYSAKDLDDDERARLRLGPTQFFTKGRISPEEFERRVIGWLHGLIARKREEGQRNGDQAYFGH